MPIACPTMDARLHVTRWLEEQAAKKDAIERANAERENRFVRMAVEIESERALALARQCGVQTTKVTHG